MIFLNLIITSISRIENNVNISSFCGKGFHDVETRTVVVELKPNSLWKDKSVSNWINWIGKCLENLTESICIMYRMIKKFICSKFDFFYYEWAPKAFQLTSLKSVMDISITKFNIICTSMGV